MVGLRVLLVSPLPPPSSGIATWTCEVGRWMEANPVVQPRIVDTAVRWRPVWVNNPGIRLTGGAIHALVQCGSVLRELLQHRPQVVHLCTSAGPALAKDVCLIAEAKAVGIPTVLHLHTSRLVNDNARHQHFWNLTLHAVGLSAASIVLDPGTEALLRRERPEAVVHRIPNPVSAAPATALPAPRSRPVVGFFGHVLAGKGVELLVRACCALDCELRVVGPVSPAFQQLLEGLASGREGGRWLRIVGPVEREDARREMQQVDIVALPSLFEAFPYVVLEGMAAGRPIVASRVGAIAEMTCGDEPNAAGVLFEPGDLVGLRGALEILVSNPEARATLGANGVERCRRFYSPDAVGAQLLDVWRECASRRGQ